MIGDQKSENLVKDLKNHLKKRVKEESFRLIDPLLTSLSEGVVVWEKGKAAVDMEPRRWV